MGSREGLRRKSGRQDKEQEASPLWGFFTAIQSGAQDGPCLLSSSREVITERGCQELLQQTGREGLTGLRAQESRGGSSRPGLDERERGLGWRAAFVIPGHRALLPSFCSLHQPPPDLRVGSRMRTRPPRASVSPSIPRGLVTPQWLCCEKPRPNAWEAVRNSHGLTPLCGRPGRPPPSRLPPSSLVRMKRGWDEAYQSLALTLSILLFAWRNLLD